MDKNTKKKVDKLTGPADVNGDVTPTLREPITKVKATDWSKMSSAELWEQRSALMQRLAYAQQSAHPGIAAQIQNGINAIDQILNSKQPDTDDTRLY